MSKKIKLPKLTDDQVNFLKIAGVGLGVYLIYKSVTKATKGFKDFFSGKDIQTEEDLRAAILEEQKRLKGEGEVLTHPLYKYKSYATTLKIAMKGATTDEDAIYNVFSKMKNDLDVTQLISEYGIHTYYLSLRKIATDMDLPQWIHEEMDEDEIAKLNGILAKNNITYRF